MKSLFLKSFVFLFFIVGLQAAQGDIFMKQAFVRQNEKFFIGLELRTSNKEMPSQVKAHWDRFFQEFFPKIPNRVDGSILALYTDYEGDYTKPFSYIVGCEVSTLEDIPEGMVGRGIPQTEYALFKTEGPFPQGVIDTWHKIWKLEKSDIKRTYTNDYEFYGPDFDPIKNPQVSIFIAVER